MDIAARRGIWRLLIAPLVALALIAGYAIYVHGGSGSPVRHLGTSIPAPAVTKLTPGDLLLAASAAKGIHLEFDTVTGPPSAVHTNHAVIKSFAWDVSAPAPVVAGGGGAGKAKVADITLTKVTDKYSVPLFTKLVTGTHVPGAIIYFTNVTTAGVAFDDLEFDLANPTVTDISMSSSGDTPSESVSLHFTAVTIKAHIAGAIPQTLTYNIATNTIG
jgi:type VI protein secretion system component Hcp